jgi:hypothetical protein
VDLNLRKMTALPFATLAAAMFAFSAPAGAATGNAAIRTSSAVSAARAATRSVSDFCGYIAQPIYTVSGPTVQLDPSSHHVIGTAAINVSARMNCSATVIFMLETKVCGFWGCNSHEMASSPAIVLPGSGTVPSTLTANCRPGTNSYQMVYRVTWAQFVGNGLETHTDEKASDWVKGSC